MNQFNIQWLTVKQVLPNPDSAQLQLVRYNYSFSRQAAIMAVFGTTEIECMRDTTKLLVRQNSDKNNFGNVKEK